MAQILMPMAMLSLLSIGAIFGFFYAWVCSTMWGLDAVDPKTAITAMQAMNASVRNLVFFPGFFGTLFFLAITALVVFWLAAKAAGVFVSGKRGCICSGRIGRNDDDPRADERSAGRGRHSCRS